MTTSPEGLPLAAVVGDVMNDVLVRPLGAFERATDTDSEIAFSPGGSAANQAAWLASLGGRVRFAGRCGAADAPAHRRALEAFGVEARLADDLDAPTGTVVAVVSPDGERSMFTDRGANRGLRLEDLEGVLVGVAHLHASAYPLFEAASRPAVVDLFAQAAAAGISVSVDPGSFAAVRQAGPVEFFGWTAGVGLLFPNLDEGRALTGEASPERVVDVLARHYAVVALKLGSAGTLVGTREGERLQVAPAPGPVVDSTGAGDAFAAGWLAVQLAGGDLPARAAGAVAAAARVLGRAGARPPWPGGRVPAAPP